MVSYNGVYMFETGTVIRLCREKTVDGIEVITEGVRGKIEKRNSDGFIRMK